MGTVTCGKRTTGTESVTAKWSLAPSGRGTQQGTGHATRNSRIWLIFGAPGTPLRVAADAAHLWKYASSVHRSLLGLAMALILAY